MAALPSNVRWPRPNRGIRSWMTAVIATLLASSPGRAADGTWQEVALEWAVHHHQTSKPDVCEAKSDLPVSYGLQLGEETAARGALLVAFACRSLDTGRSTVFVLSDQHGTVSDVVFPTPLIAPADKAPLQATIGWEDRREVINAAYDPDGRTMIAVETWPGSGEIRSRTQWGYYLGLFRLMRFEIDAAADGEQELVELIDNEIW